MAGETQAEQFTHYVYVPASRGWKIQGLPDESAADIEQITDGVIFQRGDNLYRTHLSEYVGRVAPVSGSILEVGSQGSILLSNAVPRSRVDDPMAADRLPRLSIVGDITALGDSPTNPINRIISLAPVGELVYVRDDVASGKERYSKQLTPAPGEPVPQKLVSGWRLATSEELILRGVAGYLARNAAAALERWKLEGYTLPDGTVTTDGSEIVKAVAASIQVQPLITYLLSGG